MCYYLTGKGELSMLDTIAAARQSYSEAQAALYAREPSVLSDIFRGVLDCDFAFDNSELHFGFALSVNRFGRAEMLFGRDAGHGEKTIAMARLMDMLPVVRGVCAEIKTGRSLWNLSDFNWSHEIGFCCEEAATLVADSEFMRLTGYASAISEFASLPAWIDRSDVPYWRGSSTGRRDGPTILDIPRARLCRVGRDLGYDFAISHAVQEGSDVGMIAASGLLGSPDPWTALAGKRYNIDIDGNTSAWASLFLKLLCGGAVLKVASPHGYRQWYYDRLVPWENFAPVRSDMSDLEEVVERLRGDAALAESIGRAGRHLAMSLTYETQIQASVQAVVSFHQQQTA